MRTGWALVALCHVGCASTEHTPVDVQLDVLAPLPVGTEWVRLCVDDGPTRQFGAATGRFALTGLFTERPQWLTADALDVDETVLARVGPIELEPGWVETGLMDCAVEDCGPPCDSADVIPPQGMASFVLGLRFVSGSSW